MKTEVKKLDATKMEIAVEASGEIVKTKFEDVFKKISQDARVPGFRAGHVPRDILEKHFSHQAHQQVLKELVPQVYNDAIAKENLDVIELPEIFDVKLDRANISFKAHVEVSPEIELRNYKGHPAVYKRTAVSAEEIKRAIDAMKDSRKAEAVDESFARGLGYPDLAELEKAIERQLFLQKENAQRQKIENDIIERVIKEADFTLPQSLVKRQLEDSLRQAKLDLALKGLPREKIDEHEKDLIKELLPQSERQVRVYLLFSAIAKKENIPLDDHMMQRVMELLLKEASWQESS